VAGEVPVTARIVDVIKIRGRDGQLALFKWEGGEEPKTGDVFRRPSDGAEWIVHGVESRMLPLRKDDPVGLLLRGPKEVIVNDELEKKP
jgi:hypothetical protein